VSDGSYQIFRVVRFTRDCKNRSVMSQCEGTVYDVLDAVTGLRLADRGGRSQSEVATTEERPQIAIDKSVVAHRQCSAR